MAKAQTLKDTPVAAPKFDAEMDRLVTEAERQFTRNDRIQLVDLIDGNTRGVLTLFPFVPRIFEAGKTYPAMTGQLDTRRVKVAVSAFKKRAEDGREFLSLSIGAMGQNHIGGAVFRQEAQNPETGLWEVTPGKENERHGVIGKTVRIAGTDDYETVFELRFYGRRRLSAAGVPFIKAQVYPGRAHEADDREMVGCF